MFLSFSPLSAYIMFLLLLFLIFIAYVFLSSCNKANVTHFWIWNFRIVSWKFTTDRLRSILLTYERWQVLEAKKLALYVANKIIWKVWNLLHYVQKYLII